jgi:hypothetical protein
MISRKDNPMKSRLYPFPIGQLASLLLAVLILTACSVSPTTTPLPQLPTKNPVPPTMRSITYPVSDTYPAPRVDHYLVYDSESDQVIMFGGRNDTQNDYIEYPETWNFDVGKNSWMEMNPSVSPGCIFEPMAYDTNADLVIYYCGISGSSPSYTAIGETWSYDANSDTWKDLQSANTPTGIAASKMIYDTKSDKMIMFGGINVANGNQTINETWAFDYLTNSWTLMQPDVKPPAMGWPEMTYDSESDRLLIWGGWPSMEAKPSGERTSLWAYDYNSDSWEELINTAGPLEDYQGSMVYVPDLDRSIVYVGMQFWSYDYNHNHWEVLKSVAGGPGRRLNHAMVYDSGSGYVVLFGGFDSLNLPDNEVWFYNPLADMWAKAGP